jgi:hypothetical protein
VISEKSWCGDIALLSFPEICSPSWVNTYSHPSPIGSLVYGFPGVPFQWRNALKLSVEALGCKVSLPTCCVNSGRLPPLISTAEDFLALPCQIVQHFNALADHGRMRGELARNYPWLASNLGEKIHFSKYSEYEISLQQPN